MTKARIGTMAMFLLFENVVAFAQGWSVKDVYCLSTIYTQRDIAFLNCLTQLFALIICNSLCLTIKNISVKANRVLYTVQTESSYSQPKRLPETPQSNSDTLRFHSPSTDSIV